MESEHFTFLDFKATYDTTDRDKLLEATKKSKITHKLTGLVRATLKYAKCGVKMQNNVSEPFGTSTGARQEDALASILFKLALRNVVRFEDGN